MSSRNNGSVFKKDGFTIVELLVVIVVIGVLASISIVSYAGVTQQANVAALKSDLSNSIKQLNVYRVQNVAGVYPITLDCSASPVADSICLKSSGGNTYQYVVDDVYNPQGFCVSSSVNGISYMTTDVSEIASGDCRSYKLAISLDAGDTASYPSPFNGTTMYDLSGNNNNATLINGVGYSVSNNGCLIFDGNNDYVDMPLAGSGIYPVTIEAWFRGAVLNQHRAGIIGVGNGISGYRLTWGTDALNNNLYVLFPNVNWINLGYSASTNTWYNVAVTIERSSSTQVRVKAYVNGSLAYNNVHNNPITPVTSSSLGVEKQTPGYFSGDIGKASVYNRVLSATEVNQVFEDFRSRYGI
jgi:prepilin-type N-terminal cleavage/methylation domain-containing protein